MTRITYLLLVLSFVAGSFVGIAGIYLLSPHPSRNTLAAKRLDIIQISLDRYLKDYGHLPCPASFNTAPGDAHFGVQKRVKDRCMSDGKGIVKNASYYVGALPIDNLHLPYEYAFDINGKRIVYIVGERSMLDRKGDDIAIKTGGSYIKVSYIVQNGSRKARKIAKNLELRGEMVVGH